LPRRGFLAGRANAARREREIIRKTGVKTRHTLKKEIIKEEIEARRNTVIDT